MDKLLWGSGSTLDNDKNKKRIYNRQKSAFSSKVGHRRIPFSVKCILLAISGGVFLYLFLSSGHQRRSKPQLSNQPVYKKQENSCYATLCNPSNKCSTWLPNTKYTWSDLSQAGIYRDLSTINVSTGCELRIKVEDTMVETEWLTLSQGLTECTDNGYGVKCRNLVDLTLKADISILATQLKSKMKEKSSQGQEIILVQQPSQTMHNENDVTLVSQFSVNRLETFTTAINAWKGPISISIYLTQPNDIDELVNYFNDPNHLETYARVIITLFKPNYHNSDHLAYPINHLRNIAITESSTDYIFVLDADFTPSGNLYPYIHHRLIPYIRYQKQDISSTAWVIPCFAIHEEYEDIPLPDSYDDLRKLVGRNIAYVTDTGAGHGPTLAAEIAMVRPLLLGNPLAYEVCYESQWEPYYVLHRSAPLYDARFRNQGGDKQSHALQLNAEGYRFMVLREVFMVHKDHRSMVWPDGGFAKAQKAAQKWNYFQDFMREIESLYGSNPRWPRGCSAVALGWQDQRRDVIGMAAGAA